MPDRTSDDLLERVASLEDLLYQLRQEIASDAAAEVRPQGEFYFLSCRLGDDEVGMVLDDLEEVVPVAQMASLPESQPWVCGLLNLRGESIPVVDVMARVEHTERKLELSDLIVICVLGERRIGLVVQEVEEVHEVHGSEIQSAGDLPHAPYLIGVLELPGRSVQLLSLERLVGLSNVPELDE